MGTMKILAAALGATLLASTGWAQEKKPAKGKAAKEQAPLAWPPTLPDGKAVVTDTSTDFLKPSPTIKSDVLIATHPPTVDFLYAPAQTYPGKPWSTWGDCVAAAGKCYFSLGDHLALGGKGDPRNSGNAFVCEYDAETKTARLLADCRKILNLPEGHYTPGKIHGRLDLGSDGWLYFSTHRGSTSVTRDEFHYKGDWILRVNPATLESEVVACGPVPKHCIPNSVLDPERLIFYGGTAAGMKADGEDSISFFAYDCKNRKLLYSGPDGPGRYMIFARSTGKVYYVPGAGNHHVGKLMRFDPAAVGPPVQIEATVGLRAATQETPRGIVYTVSNGQKNPDVALWAFNVKTEEAEPLGPVAVGRQTYIASLDADPTGRYLYYILGAHGGSEVDGTAVVQYEVKTRRRKVIAFLHPFYQDKYGCTLGGTFSSAVDPRGDKLYVAWTAGRGGKMDTVAFTAIHIPEAERP